MTRLLERISRRAAQRASARCGWDTATALGEVGELTARWLLGEIHTYPEYGGPRPPDRETEPIAQLLAAVNRAGFVTETSQPGHPARPGWNGCVFEQRAGVTGYVAMNHRDAELLAAARDAELILVVHEPAAPAELGRLIADTGPIPVTRIDGVDYTWFGSPRDAADLYDTWPGAWAAADALAHAWQVTLLDPEWGRDDVLWPLLDRWSA